MNPPTEEQTAVNIYMVFAEDGEEWKIGMLGVPAGSTIETTQAFAEKKMAEDVDFSKNTRIRALVPFEMVEDAVLNFGKELDKIGATYHDPS